MVQCYISFKDLAKVTCFFEALQTFSPPFLLLYAPGKQVTLCLLSLLSGHNDAKPVFTLPDLSGFSHIPRRINNTQQGEPLEQIKTQLVLFIQPNR